MKKTVIVLVVFIAAYFAYDFYNKNHVNTDVIEISTGDTVMVTPQFNMVFDGSTHSHKLGEIATDCSDDSEIICAVETMVKCSIDPSLTICSENVVPEFVFMEDENLGRPTEIEYKVTNIKALDKETVEVHTQSECNGNWFGLCKGNVIYVADNVKGFFRVKDVYAIGD